MSSNAPPLYPAAPETFLPSARISLCELNSAGIPRLRSAAAVESYAGNMQMTAKVSAAADEEEEDEPFAFLASPLLSLFRVALLTLPVCFRPLFFWKARTADFVPEP